MLGQPYSKSVKYGLGHKWFVYGSVINFILVIYKWQTNRKKRFVLPMVPYSTLWLLMLLFLQFSTGPYILYIRHICSVRELSYRRVLSGRRLPWGEKGSASITNLLLQMIIWNITETRAKRAWIPRAEWAFVAIVLYYMWRELSFSFSLAYSFLFSWDDTLAHKLN